MSDDAPRSDRRGFFRLGLATLRHSAAKAAGALAKGQAAEHAGPVLETRPEAARSFYRYRLRGQAADKARRVLVRPPGAVPEPAFLAACTRCRKCVEACPVGALVTAGPQHGRGLEATPYLGLEAVPCVMCEGVPCAAACPTGALLPVPREAIKVGTAVPIAGLCRNEWGEPCRKCLDACPLGTRAIAPDGRGAPVVRPDPCTGCGQCVAVCPVSPRALRVEPLRG